MRFSQAIALPIVLLVFAIPADASFIRLESHSNAQTDGKNVRIFVAITNTGDESALNVRPQLIGPDVNQYLPTIAEIKPGESLEAEPFVLERPSDRPGAYSLGLIFHHTDASNYPLSACSYVAYVRGKQKPAPLTARLKDATLAGKGQIVLNVGNPSRETIIVRIMLVLPQELVCGMATQQVRLKAGRESRLKFRVHNLGAPEEANYAIFALLDYEGEGFHHSDVAAASVQIKKSVWYKEDALGIPLIPVILSLLYMLLCGLQSKRTAAS